MHCDGPSRKIRRIHRLMRGSCAALLLLCGCTRTYVPQKPRIVETPRMNAAADRVSVTFQAGTTVTLRSGARPGTALRGAKLTSVRAPRCETGVAFGSVLKDGTLETEGPIDISGSHELELDFPGQLGAESLKSPLRGSSAVDLEIESSDGTSCVRVPLGADMPERTWKLDPWSAGLLFGGGARFFPASTTPTSGVTPLGVGVIRIGAGAEGGRLWTETWLGSDLPGDFFMLGFSAGGDRPLWSDGPWAVTGGLAYDLVFSYRLNDRPAPLTYFLHGPRITPALTWAPFSDASSYPGFPLGRRTMYFELELPIAGWFGTRGAPDFTIVPGIGVNYYLTL